MKYDFELDIEKLAPPRPLKPERRAEIDETMSEIAQTFREIREMGAIL